MANNSGSGMKLLLEPFVHERSRRIVEVFAAVLLVIAIGFGAWLARERGGLSALWAKLEAAPTSPGWDRWTWGFVVLALVVAIVVLWKVPQWHVAQVRRLNSKERFDCENESRKTLATILGGALLLAGAFATWKNVKVQQDTLTVARESSERNAQIALDSLNASREAAAKNAQIAQDSLKVSRDTADRNAKIAQDTLQASQKSAADALELSRQGQITDRFTKAVEQLGAKEKLEVRLGGIYSLETIANESRDLHWPILEVLSSYVRMNAPVVPEGSGKSPATSSLVLNTIVLNEALHPPADIQAILKVLGRREHRDWEPNSPLDFSKTDLRGASLKDARLEKVIFFETRLDLSHLEVAQLNESNLNGADLSYAHLGHAHLHGAQLGEAVLWGTDLADADLSAADFYRAKLVSATLIGADLSSAQLTGADLSSAYIYDAKLQGANLHSAVLSYAHIEGTDLSSVKDLSQAQINVAVGNALTKLPPNLCLPRSWDDITASTPHACPAQK
jgi:uncharacterized protein YjbI with pentapeptide repeats